MQRTTVARNEIGPLLDELIKQLDNEGRTSQRAYFARIRRSLDRAKHETDLATHILELSTTTAVGFCFSNEADVLIARILEKAESLAAELDQPRPPLH